MRMGGGRKTSQTREFVWIANSRIGGAIAEEAEGLTGCWGGIR